MKRKSAEPDDKGKAEQMSRVEKQVLDSIPKTMKRKAQLLLDHVKDNLGIRWNEQGEQVYQGQTMEGTNMSDLVNDVLRYREKVSRSSRLEDVCPGLKSYQRTSRAHWSHEAMGVDVFNKGHW